MTSARGGINITGIFFKKADMDENNKGDIMKGGSAAKTTTRKEEVEEMRSKCVLGSVREFWVKLEPDTTANKACSEGELTEQMSRSKVCWARQTSYCQSIISHLNK